MAKAISDEELQLKRRARRRLIGAIVLVVAIVVILPMVLDSEPKSSGGDIAVQIPSQSTGVLTAKVPPPAAPAAPAVEAAKPPAAEAPVKPEPPSAKPAPVETAKADPGPKPAAAKPAPAKSEPAKPAAPSAAKAPEGKFSVQVIALADAAKAKQMQGRIEAAGIPSYTEIVKTVKGDVTRVRAGPFPTRGAAEKARDQLKALGMSGNIIAR